MPRTAATLILVALCVAALIAAFVIVRDDVLPGKRAAGIVLDLETDTPVPNATITIYSTFWGEGVWFQKVYSETVNTDANGRFDAGHIFGWWIQYHVSADGYRDWYRMAKGEQEDTLRIRRRLVANPDLIAFRLRFGVTPGGAQYGFSFSRMDTSTIRSECDVFPVRIERLSNPWSKSEDGTASLASHNFRVTLASQGQGGFYFEPRAALPEGGPLLDWAEAAPESGYAAQFVVELGYPYDARAPGILFVRGADTHSYAKIAMGHTGSVGSSYGSLDFGFPAYLAQGSRVLGR